MVVKEKSKVHHQFADDFSRGPLTKGPLQPSPDRSPGTATQSPPSSSDQSSPAAAAAFSENGRPAVRKSKLERKGSGFICRIREHVRMGPKLSETVKGKLSVGARIIRNGGRDNIFREVFGLGDGEKLLKSSQCYLSTTSGPIAGILFVSTEKVAFRSERSIDVRSSTGAHVRIPYKVSIPVRKIKGAYESENVEKEAEKYIEIVTEDNFEFWFMGFVRYEKALISLQRAISNVQDHYN